MCRVCHTCRGGLRLANVRVSKEKLSTQIGFFDLIHVGYVHRATAVAGSHRKVIRGRYVLNREVMYVTTRV